MPRPVRIPKRLLTVEHIKRRAREERRRGVVYSSIEALLEDELREEQGVPLSKRKKLRQARIAITGAGEEFGSEVVAELAKEGDFDILAIVEEFKHALELYEDLSEHLKRHHSQGKNDGDGGSPQAGRKKGRETPGKDAQADHRRIRIVHDRLDDEERLSGILSRVSQVIHLVKPDRDAAGENTIQIGEAAKPALIVATACRKAKVDRLILASCKGRLSGSSISSFGALPSGKPGGEIPAGLLSEPTSLSEEAVRLSGVPFVLARFPLVWGKDSLDSLVRSAKDGKLSKGSGALPLIHERDMAGAFGRILDHPELRNAEITFIGERLTRQRCFDAVARAIGVFVMSNERKEEAKREFLLSAVTRAIGEADSGKGTAAVTKSDIARALLGFSPSILFEKEVSDYLSRYSLASKAAGAYRGAGQRPAGNPVAQIAIGKAFLGQGRKDAGQPRPQRPQRAGR